MSARKARPRQASGAPPATRASRANFRRNFARQLSTSEARSQPKNPNWLPLDRCLRGCRVRWSGIAVAADPIPTRAPEVNLRRIIPRWRLGLQRPVSVLSLPHLARLDSTQRCSAVDLILQLHHASCGQFWFEATPVGARRRASERAASGSCPYLARAQQVTKETPRRDLGSTLL